MCWEQYNHQNWVLEQKCGCCNQYDLYDNYHSRLNVVSLNSLELVKGIHLSWKLGLKRNVWDPPFKDFSKSLLPAVVPEAPSNMRSRSLQFCGRVTDNTNETSQTTLLHCLPPNFSFINWVRNSSHLSECINSINLRDNLWWGRQKKMSDNIISILEDWLDLQRLNQ